MSTKLHEILAVEGDRESAACVIIAETETTLSKRVDHFQAQHSIYRPLVEEGGGDEGEETFKAHVTTVRDKLAHCFKIWARAIDITASKDATNQLARAEVILDGTAITIPLPATTLLMLESKVKKLIEVLLLVPTLAPGRDWVLDTDKGPGVYRDANPESKPRTKRAVMHKVLYDATAQHPAQIEKWNEDVKIGRTVVTVWSSMWTPAAKSQSLTRAQDLLAAIKQARQRANCQEVTQVNIADALFDYVLG
jgi:hypothetical protein